MSAATLEPTAPALTRVQKLAAVLVMVGPDNAAAVLKGFEPHDVAAISAAMASLPVIDQRTQREILREFSEIALTACTAIRGGADVAQQVLEKAVGAAQARQYLSQTTARPAEDSAMTELADQEPRQLLTALKGESPATCAVVLSYLSQKKASAILHSLPEETRAQIVERLATLGPVPQTVVETLATRLRDRIGVTAPLAFVETGGIRPAVSVLKSLPKDASKALLGFIDQTNPELCQTLRNQLFTFADIAKLSVGDLQKILREVDSRSLATALKGADETTTRKILAGMSKRAAEALQEEIGFLGKVKQKEIEAAQLAVIEIVRRLEGEGQVEIPEEPTT